MGFKLYDELFDYSFDDVSDIKVRYDLIAENIKKYSNKSTTELKELYNMVYEKCVHNKKVALRLATDSSLVPTVWRDLINYQLVNDISSYPETINNFIKTNESKFKEI
jgi:lysine/ornithine N-monooxygenase